MSRDPSEYVIDLYVHPDRGPVKPIRLDLMRIEVEMGQSSTGRLNTDDERLRRICEQIKARFPQIDPESNRQGLKSILSRLSHAYYFNGIVVRLNGSTLVDKLANNSSSPVPAAVVNDDVQRQLAQLQRELPRLKVELEVEQRSHRAAKERCVQLEKEKQLLEKDRGTIYDHTRIQIDDLRLQLRHKDAEIVQIRREAAKSIQEQAALQTRYELQTLQLEEQQKAAEELHARIKQQEGDQAGLRAQNMSAKQIEKQLRQTIDEQSQDLIRLRQQLERLMEAETAEGEHTALHSDMLE